MTGTRPVIDFMFADFVLDAVGEILNQIAKVQYMSSGRLTMPVMLRGCIGVGQLGRHAPLGQLLPDVRTLPRPARSRPIVGPYDAKGLLAHALRGDDPVLFLEHRGDPFDQGARARGTLRDRVRQGERSSAREPT